MRLERTKIARELHDVVAHCMTVIVIQSRAGRHLLDSDPAAAKEALDVIVAVAAEAEADIGALVKLMDPELTRPLTRSLLDELVTRAGATGATVTAEIAGDPAVLAPATAVVAHRVVQEAITNAFRHTPGARHPDRADRWAGVHPRGDQRRRRCCGPPGRVVAAEHDGAELRVESPADWEADGALSGSGSGWPVSVAR